MNSIWVNGAKNILAYVKKSLLDYIDALIERSDPKTQEALGKVKGRVHNDISQAMFSVGTLIATLESGGDISPFEEELNRKEERKGSMNGRYKPFKELKKKVGEKNATSSSNKNSKITKDSELSKSGSK